MTSGEKNVTELIEDRKMVFNRFQTSIKNFIRILRIAKPKGDSELFRCYMETSDFDSEIEIITKRIEKELTEFVKSEKMLLNLWKKDEEHKSIDRLLPKTLKLFIKLRLDIKDFFIHTRMFLDIIARIVKVSYGKKGMQLNDSMSGLLKNEKSIEINKSFFKELREKMNWYNDFVREGRDIIVHKRGHLVFTNTKDGKFGFDILKRLDSTWGTETVNSIEDFIDKSLENLSEVLDYLTENLKFSLSNV